MSRSVDGTRRKNRRKKTLKLAKGFRGKPGKLARQAMDAVAKAGQNAYNDRRRRKREFRRLWISRISAGCRQYGLRYSEFISCLNSKGVAVNRKTLSNMLIDDPQAFKAVVELAKG